MGTGFSPMFWQSGADKRRAEMYLSFLLCCSPLSPLHREVTQTGRGSRRKGNLVSSDACKNAAASFLIGISVLLEMNNLMHMGTLCTDGLYNVL